MKWRGGALGEFRGKRYGFRQAESRFSTTPTGVQL
jgi:hypothetical protein